MSSWKLVPVGAAVITVVAIILLRRESPTTSTPTSIESSVPVVTAAPRAATEIENTSTRQPPRPRLTFERPRRADAGTATVQIDDDPRFEPELRAAREQFDAGDYAAARSTALRLLAKREGDVGLLRIAIGAACAQQDREAAADVLAMAPTSQHDNLILQCAQYGLDLVPPKRPARPRATP